ncbi:RNA polymerase sigma factor [Polyangium aurulentum]|uniref:RNA polymerase sigma factor n=1 Tax=Polyangium aurulentum TaxID=2567896 RepID=UPI00146B543F|nr:sigma-70 family RNA polymerase sigma factor [Polyangium aurulentum]UQA57033.1 sigma-70 family RNA polymerase sigma factor [Polyangium aurulentum]
MSRPSSLDGVIAAILGLRPSVVRWMSRWGYQDADCQDLAQQTTEASVNAAGTYDPARAAVNTWLYRRARDIAREHAERIGHYASMFWGEPGSRASFASSGPSPEEEVGRMEVLRFILKRLRHHLKPNLFDVLVARALHELDEGQVAEAFQWPIGTVRSRFRKAVQKAKECLAGYEHELRSVMPLVYELDGEATVAAAVAPPKLPRLRPAHALLIPAVAAPPLLLLLLLLPQYTLLLSARSWRPIEIKLRFDGAGASEAASPAACECPTTVCARDEPLGPTAPRALVRKIDHALVHGDEPGARAALLYYLRAYPGDPLRVRAQFAWLLKR